MKKQNKNTEQRLIIAGFGGQGILTAGKLLCTSCLAENKNVTYLPSYGSEVRGGTANCHVVVSEDEIYSPAVDSADSMVILNKLSFEKFADNIKPGGLLLLNSSMIDVCNATLKTDKVIRINATDIAAGMGNVIVANIIMLGAFIKKSRVCRIETVEESIRTWLSDKNKSEAVDLNLKALHHGAE